MLNEIVKRIMFAVGAIGMITMAPVSADCYTCDPCDYDPCGGIFCDWCLCRCLCGKSDFGVDFIFWKPCINDLQYAFDNDIVPALDTTSTGRYKEICHSFEPGFRAHFTKEDLWCNDWDFWGSYTYLRATGSDGGRNQFDNALQSTLLSNLLGEFEFTGPSFVTATHTLNYQTFDLLLAKKYCPCACHNFTPFFGVEWMSADQSLNHDLLDSSGEHYRFLWSADFWGVGWKFGTLYEVCVCDCVDVFVKGSGTLLAGKHESVNNQQELRSNPANNTTWKFKYDECICVPGWYIAAGANYHRCFCGYEVTGRLGYEFINWVGMPTPPRLYGKALLEDFASATSPTTAIIGFHGLFAGLTVTF